MSKAVEARASPNGWGRHLPLVHSLRGYTRATFRNDFAAGLTTAIVLVPQGMAYALLAGVPPVVGLYAALVPALGYALLGTSRQLSVGPVAMDSLLVAAGVGAIANVGSGAYMEAVVLLALLVGSLQLAFGVLRLGFLVNFLSLPVMSGFTSAAAILIALSQLKHLLGIALHDSLTAWPLLAELPAQIMQMDGPTLLIGATATVVLLLFKRYLPQFPAPLLVVSAAALTTRFLDWGAGVAIVGFVPGGLPTLTWARIDQELLLKLLPVAFSIALIGYMESIAVAKAFARKNKYPLSANRELVALGFSNILAGLFSGFPVAGGFSRSAVNAQAGAQTQLASLVTALFVALSLWLFTPLFFWLPKAALSAMIVVAVLGLIDLAEVRRLRRIKRSDLVLLLVTFFATLSLGATQGLGVGVLASLAWVIYQTTRPHVAVLGRVPGTTSFRNIRRYRGLVTYEGILIVRLDAQFYFGNVQFLKETLFELESRASAPLKAIILDASAINAIDSSGEAALREFCEEHVARGVSVYVTGVKGPVRDVIQQSGLAQTLGEAGRYLSVHEALTVLGRERERNANNSHLDTPTHDAPLHSDPLQGAPLHSDPLHDSPLRNDGLHDAPSRDESIRRTRR